MWEMVAFAPQCGRGSCHLIPELSYVEVLRNGRPCQPGEVGEIVGTHLDNYAMPLIRYNMNDLATPVGSPCECGRTLGSIRLIGGKGRNLVVTPRGYVVLPAGHVTAKLDPPVRIEKLQFYQEHKEELLVRIVRGNGHTEDDTRRLLAQVDRMLEGAAGSGGSTWRTSTSPGLRRGNFHSSSRMCRWSCNTSQWISGVLRAHRNMVASGRLPQP